MAFFNIFCSCSNQLFVLFCVWVGIDCVLIFNYTALICVPSATYFIWVIWILCCRPFFMQLFNILAGLVEGSCNVFEFPFLVCYPLIFSSSRTIVPMVLSMPCAVFQTDQCGWKLRILNSDEIDNFAHLTAMHFYCFVARGGQRPQHWLLPHLKMQSNDQGN